MWADSGNASRKLKKRHGNGKGLSGNSASTCTAMRGSAWSGAMICSVRTVNCPVCEYWMTSTFLIGPCTLGMPMFTEGVVSSWKSRQAISIMLNDAAVDGDNLPGDISRLGRGEKPDQVGNFAGSPSALHRHHARDILGVERRFGHGGVDNAGCDRVDG